MRFPLLLLLFSAALPGPAQAELRYLLDDHVVVDTTQKYLLFDSSSLPPPQDRSRYRPNFFDPCRPNARTMDSRDSAFFEDLTPPSAITEIASKLNALSDCAKKIWPQGEFGSYQVLLIDPSSGQPWLWRPKGFNGKDDAGGLDRVPASEIKDHPEWSRSTYTFTHFRGKRTVAYKMNKNGFLTFEQAQAEVEQMKKLGRMPKDFVLTPEAYEQNKKDSAIRDFSTLVHEGFHAYGQGTGADPTGHKWAAVRKEEDNDAKGINNRYENFPLEYGPRLFRRMQYDALAKAVAAPPGPEREKFVAEAAYWQDKYKASGDEPSRTAGTDVLEGTAKYFDFMALTYAKHGCNHSKDVMDAIVRKEAADLVAFTDKAGGLPPVASLESYNIGLLTNVLIAQQDPPPADWQQKIQAGTPPLDLLVKDHARQPAPENEKAKKAIQEMQAMDTRAFTPVMEGLAKHENSSDYVRVQLPDSAGSVQHLGYYKFKDLGDPVISVLATKLFDSDQARVDIQNLSMVTFNENACGPGSKSNFIYVPRSALQTKTDGTTSFRFTDPETAPNSERFKDKVPTAEGSGRYTSRNVDGKDWLCLN